MEKRYMVFRRTANSFSSFAKTKRFIIRSNLTLQEAKMLCDNFNPNRNAAQIRKGTKYEFESIN